MHVVINLIVLSHHKIYKVQIHFQSHISHTLKTNGKESFNICYFPCELFQVVIHCKNLIDTMEGRGTHSYPPPPSKQIFLNGGIIACLSLTLPGENTYGLFPMARSQAVQWLKRLLEERVFEFFVQFYPRKSCKKSQLIAVSKIN